MTLYFSLISQSIKTNKVFPLISVFVFDLIITVTKPISYTTDQIQCKTLSQVANTYNAIHTCLVFKGHLFTLTKKII